MQVQVLPFRLSSECIVEVESIYKSDTHKITALLPHRQAVKA